MPAKSDVCRACPFSDMCIPLSRWEELDELVFRKVYAYASSVPHTPESVWAALDAAKTGMPEDCPLLLEFCRRKLRMIDACEERRKKMLSNIEVNGLAYVKVCLDQAGNALTQEELSEVRDLLLDAEKTTERAIGWIRVLAENGVVVPAHLTWIEYGKRCDERENHD